MTQSLFPLIYYFPFLFYFPDELRRCLPAMIVDILEEVLEQYYVDFITNMLMKSYSPSDTSVGPDNEMTVGELERPRKRLAISYDSLPENWVEMESKFVSVPSNKPQKYFSDIKWLKIVPNPFLTFVLYLKCLKHFLLLIATKYPQ